MRPATATIAIDGAPARRISALVANNTRHTANFVAPPDASCRDGVFEILEILELHDG
jgi:hypothetical protein